MKKKQLRIRNVDVSFCLTAGEIRSWLGTLPADQPIILKCNNKNYRLAGCEVIQNKPVLIGRRSKRDVK